MRSLQAHIGPLWPEMLVVLLSTMVMRAFPKPLLDYLLCGSLLA